MLAFIKRQRTIKLLKQHIKLDNEVLTKRDELDKSNPTYELEYNDLTLQAKQLAVSFDNLKQSVHYFHIIDSSKELWKLNKPYYSEGVVFNISDEIPEYRHNPINYVHRRLYTPAELINIMPSIKAAQKYAAPLLYKHLYNLKLDNLTNRAVEFLGEPNTTAYLLYIAIEKHQIASLRREGFNSSTLIKIAKLANTNIVLKG